MSFDIPNYNQPGMTGFSEIGKKTIKDKDYLLDLLSNKNNLTVVLEGNTFIKATEHHFNKLSDIIILKKNEGLKGGFTAVVAEDHPAHKMLAVANKKFIHPEHGTEISINNVELADKNIHNEALKEHKGVLFPPPKSCHLCPTKNSRRNSRPSQRKNALFQSKRK